MIGRPGPRVVLALASLLTLLAGGTSAFAQNLTLTTDRGCGDGAVVPIGELLRISFGSNRTVSARLTLTKPDGTTQSLFNGTLQGGSTRVITGRVGSPEGPRTLTLTAGTASVACAWIAGTSSAASQEARVLGNLDFHGTQEPVKAPTSVRAGEEFQVTITTFGGGCERKGDEGVLLTETGATVMVYDFTQATRPGVPCTDILKQLTHTVTLRFTQPGQAVIQIWGRRVGPDTPPSGVPIVLERRITVQ